MCILFIAIQQHPDYPLIIAANRDEFYARPTRSSQFWAEEPDILAGMDLQSGGSWMGINRRGYLAALTNFRAPHLIRADAPSRGFLVSNYLRQPEQNYSNTLLSTASDYNGFNLLYGHWTALSVFNNVTESLTPLTKGVYGLSNANLDTPWPKLTSGVDTLSEYLQQAETVKPMALFDILSNQELATDNELPDTGISKQWEKALSSIFINLESYGTRSSTLLMIDKAAQCHWLERVFNDKAELDAEEHFQFGLSIE